MKFLKRITLYQIGILFFAIVVVLVLVLVIKIVYPSSTKNLYGNRLIENSNHVIDNNKIDEMKAKLKENTKINEVTYNLKGRIINLIIDVKATMDLNSAKSLSDTVLKSFTDDQKSYYDIQIFITTIEESNTYPIIGYKHHTSNIFLWTKNANID